MRGAGACVLRGNTMSAMFLQRLARELERHKPPTMAEANLQWETAKVDFENVLLDSGLFVRPRIQPGRIETNRGGLLPTTRSQRSALE